MMSLRLLSSSRIVAPYLRQSSLQAHTSAILLNSKDSSSSSSSSDSSDLDSNKEDEKIKKFDEKAPSEISKDAGATLKTSDSNEKLNSLLQKISQASPKTKTSLSNAEKEIKIEGLPSFVSTKTKSTDTVPKKAKIEAKNVDDSSSSSSSSSSSDSSDSDSDREDQKVKRYSGKTSLKSSDSNTTLKTSETNERLNMLLKNINETSQKTKSTAQHTKKEIKIEGLPSFISSTMKPKDGKITKSKAKDKDDDTSTKGKTINVAIKPKKIRFNQVSEEEKLKQKPHEYQIQRAAKDVAEALGGDAQKTELELLTKALNLKQESSDSVSLSKEEKSLDLRGLLAKMKADTVNPDRKDTRSNLQRARMKFTEPSVAESILYKKSITRPKRYQESPADELRLAHPVMGILKKISKENKDGLQLPTWNAMEVREMRLATLTVPQNVFQELIQWTNEGKIWHFPIDNEQGMEEEKNVHFSEHVFMDRHLKGWCPKKGPIRHFMELVCNGLSKNSYMTVEEKIEHITWYKNYFEDKKELLHELGVLDTPTPSVSSTDKKKIEA